jgi:putative YjhG/YagF family dehydratase
MELNRQVPRIVDCLPNGPRSFATVQVFLAGAVPEVMLHLRNKGLLDTSVMTVSGMTLGACLDWWQDSSRRFALRGELQQRDGIDHDDVIMSPDKARERGLTATVSFPAGNIAPEGSVVKSTSIDASLIGQDNVYRKRGLARVFVSEKAAIHAIKEKQIADGDVLVLICGGPLGSGMQEIYQITSALKHLHFGKHIAVITDARFSGVSTGACIGHVSPEALAGGPVGKLRDGDLIEIILDRHHLEASVNFVGENGEGFSPDEGAQRLAKRPHRADLAPDPLLPEDTRLWAALTQASGGVWAGCVYDVELITQKLR